jgi:hypothetical protein
VGSLWQKCMQSAECCGLPSMCCTVWLTHRQ